MGERKGLVWPNVARIIELLKEKAQDDADFASVKSDVEKLERLTGLDLRTAVKILA